MNLDCGGIGRFAVYTIHSQFQGARTGIPIHHGHLLLCAWGWRCVQLDSAMLSVLLFVTLLGVIPCVTMRSVGHRHNPLLYLRDARQDRTSFRDSLLVHGTVIPLLATAARPVGLLLASCSVAQ